MNRIVYQLTVVVALYKFDEEPMPPQVVVLPVIVSTAGDEPTFTVILDDEVA